MAAQQQGKRRAYLALPTYQWLDIFKDTDEIAPAQAIIPVLIKLGLLPNSLDMYGREHDRITLNNILQGKGFDVETEAASAITADSFKRSVQQLVAECGSPNDVLVIAFCGHGILEPYARHGSLLFSDNQRVTSVWMDHALATTPASVYVLLNSCMAAKQYLAVPNGASCFPAAGLAAIDSIIPPQPQASSNVTHAPPRRAAAVRPKLTKTYQFCRESSKLVPNRSAVAIFNDGVSPCESQ